MKKNLVLIINTINSTLADVLSVEIESLDENTDLSNEKQTVIDVLENIIELYSIVKDGMNDDILKDNYQDIGKLLNLLMTSKTQEGIFSSTESTYECQNDKSDIVHRNTGYKHT